MTAALAALRNFDIERAADLRNTWAVEEGNGGPESGEVPREGAEAIEAFIRACFDELSMTSPRRETDVHGKVEVRKSKIRCATFLLLRIVEVHGPKALQVVEEEKHEDTSAAHTAAAVVENHHLG